MNLWFIKRSIAIVITKKKLRRKSSSKCNFDFFSFFLSLELICFLQRKMLWSRKEALKSVQHYILDTSRAGIIVLLCCKDTQLAWSKQNCFNFRTIPIPPFNLTRHTKTFKIMKFITENYARANKLGREEMSLF